MYILDIYIILHIFLHTHASTVHVLNVGASYVYYICNATGIAKSIQLHFQLYYHCHANRKKLSVECNTHNHIAK